MKMRESKPAHRRGTSSARSGCPNTDSSPSMTAMQSKCGAEGIRTPDPRYEGSSRVSTCRLMLDDVGLFPLHSRGSVVACHVMSSRDGQGRRVLYRLNQGQHR